MKLKDIIEYLDMLTLVKICQTDVYSDLEEYEDVFFGCVMNIPWVFLDMYIDNDENGEGIAAGIEEGRGILVIFLREKPRVE